MVGDATEARACGERALRVALPLGQRGDEAAARWLFGCTADTAGSAEDAFGLGKLSRRTGRREQAQEHLTTATTMYREMDMRFWLEQAEAELNVLR